MDINDYSARLSQAREDYHDKAKQLRENYDRDTTQLDQTHKYQRENQANAYQSARDRLEGESARMTEQQAKSSKEELARLQESFNHQRELERADFDKESAKKQNDFQNRLRNIQESYYDSAARKDKANAETVDRIKSNLEGRLENSAIEQNRTIDNLQRSSANKYKEFQNATADEKRELLRQQGQTLTDVVENNNKKHADLAQKNQVFTQELKRVNDDQHRNTVESYEQRIGEQRKNNTLANTQLVENFNDQIGKMQRKSEVNDLRAQEESARALRNQELQLRKELAMEKRRVDSVIDSKTSVDGRPEVEVVKKKYEDRLDSLRNQMADGNYQNQLQKEKIWQNSVDSMKENSMQHQKNMENQDKLNAQYNAKQIERSRFEKDAMFNQFTDEMARKNKLFEEQMVDNQNKSTIKYDTQRMQLGSQINYLQERNVETIAEIQKSNAKEKTEFIEQAKKDLHVAKEELKDDLSFKYKKVINSYEKKVASLEQLNMNLVTHYEERLHNMKQKTAEEIEAVKLMESQRKEADARNFKRAMETKVRESDMIITNIRSEFDKKLSESKHNHELQLAKTIDRYESLLKQQDRDHKIDTDKRLGEAQQNYDRLYQTSEMEKEALRGMYEVKIQKLREANERAWETQKMRMAAQKNLATDGSSEA